MIAAQRRNLILEAVRADGAVSIADLASRLDTSAVTIRRDLDYLDSLDMLTRTHGGAVSGEPMIESSYAEKTGQAVAEKQAIGRLAASLVRDGDVIVIGPGTTTEAFAAHLVARSGLTVITNSLPVAQAFVASPGNEVVVTGGTLRASIRALVGEANNRTLRGVHADAAFLSGNGLVPGFGLSTPNLTVAEADRAMVGAARSVVVLADHTKFGIRTAIQTVPAESITHLVTDSGTPPGDRRPFESSGTVVHIAGAGTGLLNTI